MAWKHLEIGDLRTALSEQELDQLGTLSLDSSKVDVIL